MLLREALAAMLLKAMSCQKCVCVFILEEVKRKYVCVCIYIETIYVHIFTCLCLCLHTHTESLGYSFIHSQ